VLWWNNVPTGSFSHCTSSMRIQGIDVGNVSPSTTWLGIGGSWGKFTPFATGERAELAVVGRELLIKTREPLGHNMRILH